MKTFFIFYISAWKQTYNNIIAVKTAVLLCALLIYILKGEIPLIWIVTLFFVPLVAEIFEWFYVFLFWMYSFLLQKKQKWPKKQKKEKKEMAYNLGVILMTSIIVSLIIWISSVKDVHMPLISLLATYILIPHMEWIYSSMKLSYLKDKIIK